MKIIGIIILLIGCFVLWQHLELKKFQITFYEYRTKKITQSVKFAVVADLHAHVYGRDNDILIQKIKEQKPDIILVPGDMIVSRYPETYETAYQTFEKLTEIAPVYFSNGNHESRVSKVPVMQTEEFLEYENRVRKLGVHILNNASEEVILHGGKFCISGLEIPLECYGKGSYEPLPEHFQGCIRGCKAGLCTDSDGTQSDVCKGICRMGGGCKRLRTYPWWSGADSGNRKCDFPAV